MTTVDKRMLFISGQKDEVNNLLNNLGPWKLSTTNTMGFKYVLLKDDIEIYLKEYHSCEDFLIMHTSSILPQDQKNTHLEMSKDILFTLYKILKKQIENIYGNVMVSITLSSNDLNK